MLIGYLLGSLNPAALLGKLKKKNLKEMGTHNLGASNTMLILGKRYGALVMLFDIFKSWLASRLVKLLFPHLLLAGLIAGLAAVLGHVFPFYLNFSGGKGLAAFGGMVLAYDPAMFLVLLLLGILLMILVNYSYIMPMSAATLFPILVALQTKSLAPALIAAAASAVIIVKHWGNIARAKQGDDLKIRDFIARSIFHLPVRK